jgi:cell division protein FtsI (penicillin-binding protein 3)
MAEILPVATARPKARARRRLKLIDALADAAIVWLRRYLPKNFGVDLEPPGARPPLPAGARKTKLKAFARELLSTRLDRSSARVRTLAFGLFVAYAGIGVKLLALGLSHDPPQTLKAAADDAVSGARPDLLDRNGAILATDVKTMSVFAEPNRIIDVDEAVELITAVLPDVDAKQLRERLASKKGFIWVKRQITAKEQASAFCRRTSASIPTARLART